MGEAVMEPLNSSVEVGVRVLALLDAAYPRSFDIDRLSLLDHIALHSADFGGPPSVLPELAQRRSELTVNRRQIEDGLSVMVRAKLIEIDPEATGIQYIASDSSAQFVRSVHAKYLERLRESGSWAVARFGDLNDAEIGQLLRQLAAITPTGDERS